MFITICAALTAFFAGMCVGQYKVISKTVTLTPANHVNGNVERLKKLRSNAVNTSVVALVINVYNFFLIFG